jgi:prepilin-type N-terminal cleavage/methylation domain-containing protein
MQKPDKQTGGFTMIELIASLVLLGIIGIFTSLFLYTGIKGYLRTKQSSEGAMTAQIALDRIYLELRKIDALPIAPVTNTSITYTSEDKDLPGTRKILYDSNAQTISIEVDGTANILLDQIDRFTLSCKEADLNNSGDGINELAGIEIGFTMTDIGQPFNLQIYPRNWLTIPH